MAGLLVLWTEIATGHEQWWWGEDFVFLSCLPAHTSAQPSSPSLLSAVPH